LNRPSIFPKNNKKESKDKGLPSASRHHAVKVKPPVSEKFFPNWNTNCDLKFVIPEPILERRCRKIFSENLDAMSTPLWQEAFFFCFSFFPKKLIFKSWRYADIQNQNTQKRKVLQNAPFLCPEQRKECRATFEKTLLQQFCRIWKQRSSNRKTLLDRKHPAPRALFQALSGRFMC
jgi:hypothetical protein